LRKEAETIANHKHCFQDTYIVYFVSSHNKMGLCKSWTGQWTGLWTQSDCDKMDWNMDWTMDWTGLVLVNQLHTDSKYHQSYDGASPGLSKCCFPTCWGIFP